MFKDVGIKIKSLVRQYSSTLNSSENTMGNEQLVRKVLGYK